MSRLRCSEYTWFTHPTERQYSASTIHEPLCTYSLPLHWQRNWGSARATSWFRYQFTFQFRILFMSLWLTAGSRQKQLVSSRQIAPRCRLSIQRRPLVALQLQNLSLDFISKTSLLSDFPTLGMHTVCSQRPRCLGSVITETAFVIGELWRI